MSYGGMRGHYGLNINTKPASDAAWQLDDLKIPWEYGPIRGLRPDFRLWPAGKHPWYLETRPAVGMVGDLPTTLRRLDTLQMEHPDAVLLLWLVGSERTDQGRLFVKTPGGEWVSRVPAEYLGLVAQFLNSSGPVRRPWWRRVFGRSV